MSHRAEERVPSYGGVMPEDFGGTDSLFRFILPLPTPRASVVRTQGVHIYDQKGLPICTAAATTTLLELAGAAVNVYIEDIAVSYIYLAGKHLVSGASTGIQNQVEGGLPLAACIQGLCTFGAIAKRHVPFPDDPFKLEKWMASENLSFEVLSSKFADLPGDLRPLRIYPSLDSLRATILGGKAIAFSFRIGPVADEWMRNNYLSHGSPTFPPIDDLGPRLATHAAVIIGYDDDKNMFLVQNSFGEDWGMQGFFWISFDTVLCPRFSGSEFYALG